MNKETFEKLKKFTEENILPWTKDWTQSKRDNLRNVIRYLSIDEEILRKNLFRVFSEDDVNDIFNGFKELLLIEEKEKKKTLTKYKKYFFGKEEPNKEEPKKEISEEEVKQIIKENYSKIIIVLKRYIDMNEKYYNIIALWIIGSYFHSEFPTYPYLFFNAMKGSGKTRTLKLISILVKNGKLLASLREAVLFRTAKDRTFCIDELERIGSKEKQALRELLNAAYKKGISVERAIKFKTEDLEDFKIIKFDVYCPIAMANIWGMEDVLSDRCITFILEKSNKQNITRLLEIFDQDTQILEIKNNFTTLVSTTTPNKRGRGVVDAVNVEKKQCLKTTLYQKWNAFITNNDINNTNNINNTNDTNDTTLFNRIIKTSLDSRNLELFFPLFILARDCEVLEETIETAETISKLKKSEDLTENRDISLIDFISAQEETKEFISMKELIRNFKEFLSEEDEDVKWINIRWLGHSLKRLNLIKDKRRVRKGREVTLDYKKAQEKIKMFKEVEPKQPKADPHPPTETPQKPQKKPKVMRIEDFADNRAGDEKNDAI